MSKNAMRRSSRGRWRFRELAAWALALGLLGAPWLLAGSRSEPAMPAEIASPATAGRVVFPHAYHVEELGYGCVDCHHETEAAPLRTPHPDYLLDSRIDCGSCHRDGLAAPRPQSCATCHGHPADLEDRVLSAKVAIHRSCWQCHEVGTGADASRGCSFCHEVTDEE